MTLRGRTHREQVAMTPTVPTTERQVPTIARINISANGGNENQEPRRAIVCRTYQYQGRGDGRRFESWKEKPNQLPTHEKRAVTQPRGSWSLQFITPKGFL